MNLQLGPLATRVHAIIDCHLANLPPGEKQGERDRVWRLALHRMDLRKYSPSKEPQDGGISEHAGTSSPEEPGKILFTLDSPEPDIQEMMDESEAQATDVASRISLLMWGMKVFSREDPNQYAPSQWRDYLERARTEVFQPHEDSYDPGRGGPGFVASVCARDHWEEMSAEEREWCVNVICSEVEFAADHWHQYARCQKFSMSGDRPSARVLPGLLGRQLDATQRARVQKTLVLAVTHAIDEVRAYAAHGIADSVWAIDRDLALRCANALAAEATLIQSSWDAEMARARQNAEEEIVGPDDERRQIEEVQRDATLDIRQRFFDTAAFPDDAHATLDQDRWFGAEAGVGILAMFCNTPTELLTIAAFRRMASTLVRWWDHDGERDEDGRRPRRERNHKTESALTDLLERFLMRVDAAEAASILAPVLDAVDRRPEKIHWILRMLIALEDRYPNTAHFWSLWKLFADRIHSASWLRSIDNEHPHGGEMMSAIFLGSRWKENVRRWRSLEGYAHNIDAMFDRLPQSSAILDDYVRFLYHIGEQSLPGAFVRIANRTIPSPVLRRNTIFMLETLLRRYVYGKPTDLKAKAELRNAVLRLLDILVESGSSAAFRMRDDFVTPLSGG